MHAKDSLDFQEVCREVRSRFPLAFGSLAESGRFEGGQDGGSWVASLPDRVGLHQVQVPEGVSSGSLELLLAAVEETGRRGMRMVWIDPSDCLDPPTAFDASPRHLLWARGGGLRMALRVADTVARDENFPFVCLDGAMIAAGEWKRVPLSQWYRLQRLVRRHGTSLILWTPPVSIPPAERRWTLQGGWDFERLFDRFPEELRRSVHVDGVEGGSSSAGAVSAG